MESETTLSSNMTADNIDSALVLCQCIEDWQESSNINDVKKFDWVKISANMNERGCPMSTTECCKVWKYVAYGRLFRDDEVLEIVSDEEDAYHQPLSALKRFKKESPSKPWLAANPEAEVSLLNLCRPGPNLSSVRMQFKKVKFLVPEQIHAGSSTLHPQVYNSEKAFNHIHEQFPIPTPLLSTVTQVSPHYRMYKASKLFTRPYFNPSKFAAKTPVITAQPTNAQRVAATSVTNAAAATAAAVGRSGALTHSSVILPATAAAAADSAAIILPKKPTETLYTMQQRNLQLQLQQQQLYRQKVGITQPFVAKTVGVPPPAGSSIASSGSTTGSATSSTAGLPEPPHAALTILQKTQQNILKQQQIWQERQRLLQLHHAKTAGAAAATGTSSAAVQNAKLPANKASPGGQTKRASQSGFADKLLAQMAQEAAAEQQGKPVSGAANPAAAISSSSSVNSSVPVPGIPAALLQPPKARSPYVAPVRYAHTKPMPTTQSPALPTHRLLGNVTFPAKVTVTPAAQLIARQQSPVRVALPLPVSAAVAGAPAAAAHSAAAPSVNSAVAVAAGAVLSQSVPIVPVATTTQGDHFATTASIEAAFAASSAAAVLSALSAPPVPPLVNSNGGSPSDSGALKRKLEE